VFLCLEHHDLYDTKTSQSKGITRHELIFYRDALYADVSEQLPRMSPDTERQLPIETEELRSFLRAVRESDFHWSPMLNGFEIEKAIEEGVLSITPFSRDSLCTTSYSLCIGNEALVSQTLVRINDSQGLVLRPREMAFVSTQEFLSMPFGLMGRVLPQHAFTLRGIFVTVPASVDPGYRGRLFLAITNHGAQVAELSEGEHMASIEFWLINMPPAEWCSTPTLDLR
jgi:deoxycytidine triphosphate deaminase